MWLKDFCLWISKYVNNEYRFCLDNKTIEIIVYWLDVIDNQTFWYWVVNIDWIKYIEENKSNIKELIKSHILWIYKENI